MPFIAASRLSMKRQRIWMEMMNTDRIYKETWEMSMKRRRLPLSIDRRKKKNYKKWAWNSRMEWFYLVRRKYTSHLKKVTKWCEWSPSNKKLPNKFRMWIISMKCWNLTLVILAVKWRFKEERKKPLRKMPIFKPFMNK